MSVKPSTSRSSSAIETIGNQSSIQAIKKRRKRSEFLTRQSFNAKKIHLAEIGLRLRLHRYVFLILGLIRISIMSLVLANNLFEDFYIENRDFDALLSNVTLSERAWNQTRSSEISNCTTSWNHFLSLSLFTVSRNQTNISQMKPILRAIIGSLLYVLCLDDLTISLYLMIRGGQLVRLLIKIPNIESIDYSKSFAFRALSIALTISCIINMLGFISFNDEQTDKLISSKISFWSKIYILINLVMTILMFINLSIMPILFIYTMILFKFSIEKLVNAFSSVNLDEIQMLKLKNKLSDLNDQFKEIIPYFALPLTVNFAANIFIVISSACFLMINTFRNQYTSFVFSLGLFAFIRLILVACIGNLPINICRDLIRTVYENLEQWTLNEWMCFMELKRLRKEFTVSIFSMYTVRQSSILAMLGFALNYIVILLQTENYSSANNGNSSKSNQSNMLEDRGKHFFYENDNQSMNNIAHWLQ
ncbi:hypothetical protein SSS_08704 [Sarcoptes scabiei]|uniref:Gustatory receptor n=1 Tax=Sarcoptes scabiei TaxID=52283 RepID=A0A834VGE8_SARSC|nr:hypothetical protein SSS_08704 [Sarcoptes scabiei]